MALDQRNETFQRIDTRSWCRRTFDSNDVEMSRLRSRYVRQDMSLYKGRPFVVKVAAGLLGLTAVGALAVAATNGGEGSALVNCVNTGKKCEE